MCQRRGRVILLGCGAEGSIAFSQVPGDHRLGAQYLCVRKRCIRGGECNDAHGLLVRRG